VPLISRRERLLLVILLPLLIFGVIFLIGAGAARLLNLLDTHDLNIRADIGTNTGTSNESTVLGAEPVERFGASCRAAERIVPHDRVKQLLDAVGTIELHADAYFEKKGKENIDGVLRGLAGLSELTDILGAALELGQASQRAADEREVLESVRLLCLLGWGRLASLGLAAALGKAAAQREHAGDVAHGVEVGGADASGVVGIPHELCDEPKRNCLL